MSKASTVPQVQAAGFAATLSAWQARVEKHLAHRLPSSQTSPQRLHEALRYSVLGGGKRVRAALMYATATALGVPLDQVDAAACAIELIHAYSLVHDDLPAMDDDDLRRGRPTCHKAFDEATAILAGDALQVLAFEILASDLDLPADPAVRLRLIETLARASGTAGMAGGQALDLAAKNMTLTLAEVERMHACKTGALIRASVLMAAHCAPVPARATVRPAAETAEQILDRYASRLGLAFQIQDDLLDIEGDAQLLGKATGADQAHHKPTYPSVAGLEASRQRVQTLHQEALAALAALAALGGRPEAVEPLLQLTHWLLTRRH